MKKLIFITTALLSASITFGQSNFKWEKIYSVSKSKSEIYSLTKMYIAETWKSAQNVIQNDDKEGGIILVKGVHQQNAKFMGGVYVYVYNYSMAFRIKEGRYKVSLEDVHCKRAYMQSSGNPISTYLDPFEGDNCPETGTLANPGLPKKKAIIMMAELKKELQALFDTYPIYLNKNLKENDW